MTLRGDHCVN